MSASLLLCRSRGISPGTLAAVAQALCSVMRSARLRASLRPPSLPAAYLSPMLRASCIWRAAPWYPPRYRAAGRYCPPSKAAPRPVSGGWGCQRSYCEPSYFPSQKEYPENKKDYSTVDYNIITIVPKFDATSTEEEKETAKQEALDKAESFISHIESGKDYIDGTEGKTDRLIIYCKDAGTFYYGDDHFVEPYSIYTKRIAKKGELLTHDSDQAVLTLLKTSEVIESDFLTVRIDATLRDLVEKVSQSKRNIFPVVKEDGTFIGVVSLEEVRNIMFRPELYNRFNVKKLMIYPPTRIDVSESMDSVMEKFEQTQAWNLPVLDGDKYVGYVSKSKIFNAYREVLVEISDD